MCERYMCASQMTLVVKTLPAREGDAKGTSLIPESGREEWNGRPTPVSLPGNSMERGVWWAIFHGITKSQAWLNDWAHTYIHILTESGRIDQGGGKEEKEEERKERWDKWFHEINDCIERLQTEFKVELLLTIVPFVWFEVDFIIPFCTFELFNIYRVYFWE